MAKQLKASIDHLRNAAIEIGQLVLSKKQAVAREDYDVATALKVRFTLIFLVLI